MFDYVIFDDNFSVFNEENDLYTINIMQSPKTKSLKNPPKYNYTNKADSKASRPAKHILGDKIAFKAKSEDKLAKDISAIVENHRLVKRQLKDQAEDKKNNGIEAISAKYQKMDPPLDSNSKKQREESESAEKVEFLKEFVKWYKEKSGWNFDDLKREIQQAIGTEIVFSVQSEEKVIIKHKVSGDTLYKIYFGDSQFRLQEGNVYTKKGSTKDYISDANGAFVSRYVTRGCSQDQIDSLFKFKKIKPRNEQKIIGDRQIQANNFSFGGRKAIDNLGQKEREFIHLRDGSGPDQRFLSATHVKDGRIVHSNHATTFTAEYTIKIDLAKIDKGKIFNQHTNEALDSMVALPSLRYQHSAKAELKLARYSAIKNRETLLDEIPLSAVTEIKAGNGAWQTIDSYRLQNDKWLIEEKRRERERDLEKDKLEKEERQKKDERRGNVELKKQQTNSLNTIAAEGLVSFFKGLNSKKSKVKNGMSEDKKLFFENEDDVKSLLDECFKKGMSEGIDEKILIKLSKEYDKLYT